MAAARAHCQILSFQSVYEFQKRMERIIVKEKNGSLQKRIFCGLTALATAAMVFPATAMAANDKTADGLTEDKTTVTLSVGADSETVGSDVVFVLDKSASTDIRQEAVNMLNELMTQVEEGHTVNVGVINFEQGVLDSLELTPLTSENFDIIQEYIIFHDVNSSGTNIHAGLAAGKAMLDGDSSVPDDNKHLVLVTDGVGYLWEKPLLILFIVRASPMRRKSLCKPRNH